MTDLILCNGSVIDGAGNPWFKADVAVEGNKIVKVGDGGGLEADREINVKGYMVAPGFIDIHTHSDLNLVINPKADSKLRQGITTELIGCCGSSPAPLNERMKEEMVFKISSLEFHLDIDWSTMGGYMKRLDRQGICVNVATLVGHGTVRDYVMDYDARPSTEEELEQMKKLVAQAMEDGVIGMSAGLEYAPGIYSKTEETIELCKIVARYGGIYDVDHRDEGDRGGLIRSINEVIEIAEKSKCPVQISHLKCLGKLAWGLSEKILTMIENARGRGIDITYDQYPYTASGTDLFAWTPHWAKEGGRSGLVEKMKDPRKRERIKDGLWEIIEIRGGPERQMVSTFPPNPSYEGRSIKEIADLRGKPPKDTAIELLEENEGTVRVVSFNMDEDDLLRIMRHPLHMVGSDGYSVTKTGVLGKGNPHPRYFATYPRVLEIYVREKNILTLEDAIRRMTSAPAQRLGLRDRGLIREGYKADIAVFDPKNVKQLSTFEDPKQYPVGIDYVIVNGKVAIDEGQYNGTLAGLVLRRQ